MNLLESVLPLPRKHRSRQKVYEDALELTAVLQESLFHLVNQLRESLMSAWPVVWPQTQHTHRQTEVRYTSTMQRWETLKKAFYVFLCPGFDTYLLNVVNLGVYISLKKFRNKAVLM